MKPSEVTNKHFAAVFFALFVVFGIFFAVNRYTINIIMSFISLQFALSFKTWDILREKDE